MLFAPIKNRQEVVIPKLKDKPLKYRQPKSGKINPDKDPVLNDKITPTQPKWRPFW